ncbi:MAG: class I tRNA ligase family protein, partial [Oscillospiraceae bacterium]|nr:class I tRNA ligase family protein [Oscillospiraceae bacterium]
WFELTAEEILPKSYKCPHCGGEHFTKETDTLDGWFDSGSTHAAVLSRREELRFPADIYLEGGDQYRGWFQSSLLTSIATRGAAPYRRIITHGWTVDGDGRAMHKSLGNSVAPEEVIKEYGADILRLWVSSSDYTSDVRISKNIFKQLSDIYLKIRNTARYILGNLDGFDPGSLTPPEDMEELDRWALSRLDALVRRVRESYDKYEYHPIYHGIHNFCAVEMSNFYFDVIKDRLYCDAVDSASGRSARSAIYIILDSLTRMIAPILAFTSEEIWAAMPHRAGHDSASVLLNDMPSPDARYCLDAATEDKWEKLLGLRGAVNKALELARADKVVGKSLDAEVTLFLSGEANIEYGSALDGCDLAKLFIVSKADIAEADSESPSDPAQNALPGISVSVRASEAPMCARCWTHDARVGENVEHPELCPRCAEAVAAYKELSY